MKQNAKKKAVSQGTAYAKSEAQATLKMLDRLAIVRGFSDSFLCFDLIPHKEFVEGKGDSDTFRANDEPYLPSLKGDKARKSRYKSDMTKFREGLKTLTRLETVVLSGRYRASKATGPVKTGGTFDVKGAIGARVQACRARREKRWHDMGFDGIESILSDVVKRNRDPLSEDSFSPMDLGIIRNRIRSYFGEFRWSDHPKEDEESTAEWTLRVLRDVRKVSADANADRADKDSAKAEFLKAKAETEALIADGKIAGPAPKKAEAKAEAKAVTKRNTDKRKAA